MTNEEIAKEIADREQKIAEIQAEIRELKKGYTVEWNVGDTYEVPGKGKFIIRRAPVDNDGRQSHYSFKVSKMKKDGTFSDSQQYPYNIRDAIKS